MKAKLLVNGQVISETWMEPTIISKGDLVQYGNKNYTVELVQRIIPPAESSAEPYMEIHVVNG